MRKNWWFCLAGTALAASISTSSAQTVQKLQPLQPLNEKPHYQPVVQTVTKEEQNKVHDARVFFSYYFPGQGDFKLYKNMFGPEFQYRNWFGDYVGAGVAAGYTWSSIYSDNTDIIDSSEGKFGGNLGMVPLGVSFFLRPIKTDLWALNLEAGLRYVFINSKVDFTERTTGETLSVKLDDGAVYLFTMEVDRLLTDNFYVFLGGGAQFDIFRPDMHIGDTRTRDNELKAFYARLGLKYAF